MGKFEKIIIGIGSLLLFASILFPSVKMKGYSSAFDYAHRYNFSNYTILPGGDYGESDSRYINWTKESRRLFFLDSKFEQDVVVKGLRLDKNKELQSTSIDGTIDWESEINIGRMLIEILLILMIVAGSIFFVRRK